MAEAYIVDAVRTPTGKRGGGLAHLHPADLGAAAISALIERTGSTRTRSTTSSSAMSTPSAARPATSPAPAGSPPGCPRRVPGTTVDRQCGSGQQAISFAAMGVMAGVQDLVVAGGVQQMSQIPISSAMTLAAELGFDDPFSGSTGWVDRYGTQEVSQFRGAEMIAEKWDISRDEMEAFAFESHERAIRAIDEGRFDAEIVPVGECTMDEGPRRGGTLEKMQQLPAARRGRPADRGAARARSATRPPRCSSPPSRR